MRKFISLMIALAVLLTCFCSCSRDDTVILYVAVDSTASSFDPQIASGNTTRMIVRNCFEGLVRVGSDGKIQPGVASSWTVSQDGLTYTFNIRPDARWHLTSNAKTQLAQKLPENFEPFVTANDFVFALRRAVDPSTGSKDAYMYMNIEGAEEIVKDGAPAETLGVYAPDPHTLQIKLKRRQSNFPETLAEPAAMPCNETFFNACTGRYGTYIKFLLSNGPFYLSKFDEYSYRINKSPDYSGEHTSKADYVWFYYVSDRGKLVKDISDSEYSCADLSASEYKQLHAKRSFTVTEKKNIIKSLVINPNDPALSNVSLRRAIFCATNTKNIAQNVKKDVYCGFVPEYASSTPAVTHPEIYNEGKVYDLIKTAVSELESTPVSLTVLCESEYEEAMRKLLQDWQLLMGVDISFGVKTVSESELLSAVRSGNYQIALYPVEAATDSAYEYFGAYTTVGASSLSGFTSEDADELVNELYGGDDAEFARIYSQLENMLAADAVTVPIWSESSYFVCTKGVKGVIFNGGDKLYLHEAVSE